LKGRRETLKVLLDTSFILPSLGIDVGEEVLEGLRRLEASRAEIYYSGFSVLESLWVSARLLARTAFNMEGFRLGLRSVIEGGRYRKVDESSQVFSDALELYFLGHRDMVDNVLYACSTNLGLKFLTVDAELKEFVGGRGLGDTLVSPDQLPQVR
jgi:hypothetical protein